MAITRCPNGHFYDPETSPSCPWCAVPARDLDGTRRDFQETIAVPDRGATVKVPRQGAGRDFPRPGSVDEGHTVAVFKKKLGVDPVVGWLVCVSGPDRGRDYRIRSEKNSVGRSDSMDICVRGDETISREDHAYVVYEPKKNIFRIQTGLSRGLIYLNGEEVTSSENLAAYDRIEMGESAFLFVPFCGEGFQWNAEKEE
jgi:hypothetical protein